MRFLNAETYIAFHRDWDKRDPTDGGGYVVRLSASMCAEPGLNHLRDYLSLSFFLARRDSLNFVFYLLKGNISQKE